MSEDQAGYEVDVTETNEVTVREAFINKLQEITACTEDQADAVGQLVATMIGEAVEAIFNDHNTLQSLFTAMMQNQVNNNNRLSNMLAELEKREYIVIDEPHRYSDLRVIYEGEEHYNWIFERLINDKWVPMELSNSARANLELLAGKFFDGRVGHTGYIIDARALDEDQE